MADDDELFAEAERYKKQRLDLFIAAPVSEILAVVGAKGPGAAQFGGEINWSMSFTVEAWRDAAGELQKRPLSVRREVTVEELRSFQEQVLPYAVIRMKARILESDTDCPEALLEAFVGPDSSDAALNDFATELQKPVTFEDAILGQFTLDRVSDWFSGKAEWAGQPVVLNLEPASDSHEALKTAHALWHKQAEWHQRICDYAIEDLLPLKNEVWLDEDEAELTAEEFLARMTLEEITVNADGSFDFWHNDGDLFLGHSIQIGGDLEEGPTFADIPG